MTGEGEKEECDPGKGKENWKSRVIEEAIGETAIRFCRGIT